MRNSVRPERKGEPAKTDDKIKILFIGLSDSSHTQAWIDLLEGSQIERRLFAMQTGSPPDSWLVRTYITELINRKNSISREYLYNGFIARLRYVINSMIDVNTNKINLKFTRAVIFLLTPQLNSFFSLFLGDKFAKNVRVDKFGAEIWLAHIIREWKPDIIHTLGLFDNQGGMFYYEVRKKYHLEGQGIWVHQMRGGSDMALRRYDPAAVVLIKQVLSECNQIITDNYANIDYAAKLGIAHEKFASIVPVPGTGGIDVEEHADVSLVPPSERERSIFWPKAYESPWSKGLPVLEAIRLAWDHIKPCEIYFLAVDQEVKSWVLSFSDEIRDHLHLIEMRIPHRQVIEYLRAVRVLLSPSLIDGVPNVLYEAMAYGAFPIISPLETITPIVKQDENVIFARNLHPEEISNALRRAMSDDLLVDQAAERNIALVKKIADRQRIAKKLTEYYMGLIEEES
jgi:glycosyltransferase involved in cell wall biosynthesis